MAHRGLVVIFAAAAAALISSHVPSAAAAAAVAATTAAAQQPDPGAAANTAAKTAAAAAQQPAAAPPPANSFPSGAVARTVTGRQLSALLADDGSAAPAGTVGGGRRAALAVLFYLSGDPNSDAIKPTFECLPAFFSAPQVEFVTVAYSELSLLTLMSQGLHALPVLQVNANGRKYRFSGKHRLGPMLQFVASAAGVKPLVSSQEARQCSGTTTSSSSTGSSGGVPGTGTCPVSDASAPVPGAPWCSARWACERWDGEATAEELRSQRRGPLFAVSIAFLVLRAACWLWKRSRQRRVNVGPAAPAAAA